MPFHRAPEGETGAWSNGRFVSHPPHEVKRYAGAAGYISSGARKAEKKPARVPPKTPKRCYTVPVMVTTVHPLRQMPLPCARAATENDKEIPSQEPMMKEKPIHQLPLVYKTNGNGSVFENDPEPVPFNDEQMDIIAAALAQSSIALRNEMQAAIDKAVTELRAEQDLRETVAELRGQLAALMTLVGNGNGLKVFEAEQIVRRLKVATGEAEA